jgi:hypothetical protein
MKPDPVESNIFIDDCMMDNFGENYHLCQLIRDESFGWPLQDPDMDADPFNGPSQALDFDVSVFESQKEEHREWSQLWGAKSQSDLIPESAWNQLSINVNSSTGKLRSESFASLTQPLALLDFSKPTPLPDELTLLRSQGSDDFLSRSERCLEYPLEKSQERETQWDYRQSGALERGTSVVQQPAGPGDIITIGIYTRAERAAKIQRFRQKRERRNFSKRVLYGSRKRFADSRPRVGGRFCQIENRVVKPKLFMKRGRPRKSPMWWETVASVDCKENMVEANEPVFVF